MNARRLAATAAITIGLIPAALGDPAAADDEYGPYGPVITPVTTAYTPWAVARDDGWTPDNGHLRENYVYSRNHPRKPWCKRNGGRHLGSEQITLRSGAVIDAAGLCHFPF